MNKESIFYVKYDAEEDMLLMHSKSGKSKESVEISEDIIVDIDKDNDLVGLEFFYASEFFKALNKEISRSFLENLKEVKVSIQRYRNTAWIILKFNIKERLVEEKLPAFSITEYESPLVASVAN